MYGLVTGDRWGDVAAAGSAIVALLAIVVTGFTARAQMRLSRQLGDEQARISRAQKDLADKQYRLAQGQQALQERTAASEQQLAIAHQGAQTALMWRDHVLALHDRGLDPEEIRWIMCCEDGGVGHEESNGIIDEIVGNVPRVLLGEMVEPRRRSHHRRLPRPQGDMRADPGQTYDFETEHPGQWWR